MSENQPRYDEENRFYKPLHLPSPGAHMKFRPFIYSPVTKLSEHWFTYASTRCAPFEEILYKCAYQGSRKAMEQRCWKELEDFNECLLSPKELLRYRAIQHERKKQGKHERNPEADIYWERHAH